MQFKAQKKISFTTLLLGIVTIVSGLLPSVAGAISVHQSAGLKTAGPFGTGFIYSFPSIRDCQVNDGVLVVKNTYHSALKIRSLSVSLSTRVNSKNTYSVFAFKAGKSNGEVSASSDIRGLLTGKFLGSAVGAKLEPFRKSHLWYVVVAKIQLRKNVGKEWSIHGVSVRYVIGGSIEKEFFRQKILLPATLNCG